MPLNLQQKVVLLVSEEKRYRTRSPIPTHFFSACSKVSLSRTQNPPPTYRRRHPHRTDTYVSHRTSPRFCPRNDLVRCNVRTVCFPIRTRCTWHPQSTRLVSPPWPTRRNRSRCRRGHPHRTCWGWCVCVSGVWCRSWGDGVTYVATQKMIRP